MEVSKESIYIQNLEQLYFTHNIDGDVLIFRDTDSGSNAVTGTAGGDEAFFLLTGLAKNVFQEMDGDTTLEDVMRKVIRDQNIDEEFHAQFEKDSIAFVEDLIARGFILNITRSHERDMKI